jgi:hypothetical protein
MSKKHRGRFQAQGGGTEKSESWSQDEPLSKEEGYALLEKLKNSLTDKELSLREKQFDDAQRYVENVNGGIDATIKKTFRNRKTKDVRVDIEVLAGRAFISIVLIFVFWYLFFT